MPVRKVHDWPIQRKLLLIILSTVGISLAFVMAGIVSYELATYRKRLVQEVTEVGGFIAANSAPTLAFDDAQTAQEILDTLRGTPDVAVAAIYSIDGRVFASYLRPNLPSAVVPPGPGPDGVR